MDGWLLPKDMIIEILARLPVRSLVRFRCVSEFLKAIIKCPTFINKHFLKRQRMASVVLMRRYFPPPQNDDVLSFHYPYSAKLKEEVWPRLSISVFKDISLKYDEPYYPEFVHFLGPCNGLICIIYDEYVILCNPSLREFKKLPICPFCCPKGFSAHIIGLGFGTSCTNCFKVLLIRTVDPHRRHDTQDPYIIVHLYNSNTNTWKHVEGDAIEVKYICCDLSNELFFNGACHWNAGYFGIPNPTSILTFNINTEVFKQLEYPDCFAELQGEDLYLCTHDECLSIIIYKLSPIEPQLIHIWIMKVYGVSESWTKQLVIGPHVVIRTFVFWNNDEWLLVDNNHGQLASCSLHTNEINRFQVDGVEKTLRVLNYNESLINLN